MTASDEWRKSPGKKNTRRWCGGHVGREHQVEVVMQKWPYRPEFCHVPMDWLKQLFPDQRWHCYHQEQCQACGKIMRSVRWQDCPSLPASLRGSAA